MENSEDNCYWMTQEVLSRFPGYRPQDLVVNQKG